MRKPEQRLWDSMRASLSQGFYLERHENAVGFGRPDVDVMYQGVTLPVELKVGKYPARSTTPVLGTARGLNRNQLNWWWTWRQRGGMGFILVRLDHDLYLIPPGLSEHINAMTRGQMEVYRVMDWEHVTKIMKQMIKAICERNQ